MAIFFPLQGLFNSLIYIRPRYLRARSKNPLFSARKLFFMALHHDAHPIHATETRPSPVHVIDPRPQWERQMESPRASDYSLPPRIGQSIDDGDSTDVAQDGLYSVADTVNARADESEYQNRYANKKELNADSSARPPEEEGDFNQDHSAKSGDAFQDNPSRQ
jgi:hypothetical protein